MSRRFRPSPHVGNFARFKLGRFRGPLTTIATLPAFFWSTPFYEWKATKGEKTALRDRDEGPLAVGALPESGRTGRTRMASGAFAPLITSANELVGTSNDRMI
jgi:hypothetical protein